MPREPICVHDDDDDDNNDMDDVFSDCDTAADFHYDDDDKDLADGNHDGVLYTFIIIPLILMFRVIVILL